MIRAIGPVWDGNEVWLLAAGGTLYFAFPLLYASSFSGFYLPLMMVLWLLMLRAIGIEFRTHIQEQVWKGFFDTIFGVSSILLAIFFGAALGNVVRGVPLNPDGYFFEAAVDELARGRAKRHPRLVHRDVRRRRAGNAGGSWIAVSGDQDRGRIEPAGAQSGVVVMAGAGAADHLQPDRDGVRGPAHSGELHPLADRISGARGGDRQPDIHVLRASRRNEKGAFLASCTYIIAMLVGAVFALYPNVLPASTGSQYSLTISNSAAGAHGLSVGLVWWTIGMVLAAGYFVFVYRMFRGKVKLEEGGEHGY